jgi:hypothetical protein
LLDFYRGHLTGRRLRLLVEQLPTESALVRALNDDKPHWTVTDHLLADLWSLWAKQEHPRRAEMVAKEEAAAKRLRVAALKNRFQKLKRRYGTQTS